MRFAQVGTVLSLGLMVALAGCDSRSTTLPPRTDGGTTPPPTSDGGTTTPPPPACTSECAPGEAPRCAGAGYQTCNRDADGCYRWSAVTPCASGTTCSGAGVCMGSGCPGGCCPRCDGSSCGPNSDGCGGECTCGGGLACATGGFCCTPERGSSACNRVTSGVCANLVACCAAAGGCVESWTVSVPACQAHLLVADPRYNCGAATVDYCAEAVDQCLRELPTLTCEQVLEGLAPVSCPTMFQ